ncbi:MAG: hypothetical protein ACRDJH_05465 [Thermomicrobiales bacterium]
MFRVVLAAVAIGIIAFVSVLAPSMSVVGGQKAGTPRPIGTSSTLEPCGAVAAATPDGSPAVPATPAAAVTFDIVYLDLVLLHTERLASVAAVAAVRAEHDALRAFGTEMTANLGERARRLGVWRSLWFGDQASLTREELVAAVERLGEATPGRGGIPGGFEVLGMTGIVAEACVATPDDAALLDLLIGAVDADLLLARAAVEQAEHDELRLEAAAIADRDQQWLDALIALRAWWYGGGATPMASPLALSGT